MQQQERRPLALHNRVDLRTACLDAHATEARQQLFDPVIVYGTLLLSESS
jgi:hypothetical protein